MATNKEVLKYGGAIIAAAAFLISLCAIVFMIFKGGYPEEDIFTAVIFMIVTGIATFYSAKRLL